MISLKCSPLCYICEELPVFPIDVLSLSMTLDTSRVVLLPNLQALLMLSKYSLSSLWKSTLLSLSVAHILSCIGRQETFLSPETRILLTVLCERYLPWNGKDEEFLSQPGVSPSELKLHKKENLLVNAYLPLALPVCFNYFSIIISLSSHDYISTLVWVLHGVLILVWVLPYDFKNLYVFPLIIYIISIWFSDQVRDLKKVKIFSTHSSMTNIYVLSYTSLH